MKFLLLPFLLVAPPMAGPTPIPKAAPARSAAPASANRDAVLRPLRLTLAATSAFGVTHARFFNQLVGLRLDYRFSPRFAFGGALAYTNLEGKDERAHNVLPEVFSEYRIPLKQEAFGLPLRLALGDAPGVERRARRQLEAFEKWPPKVREAL